MSSISMALAAWLKMLSAAPSGSRRILVHRDLQQRGRRSAGSLLEAGDGLTESLPTSVAVGFLKLWLLHPAQQSIRANSDAFCSFLNLALRERGRNGFFFLTPEFRTVAYHLPLSDAT
jgi:hypothetical protein